MCVWCGVSICRPCGLHTTEPWRCWQRRRRGCRMNRQRVLGVLPKHSRWDAWGVSWAARQSRRCSYVSSRMPLTEPIRPLTGRTAAYTPQCCGSQRPLHCMCRKLKTRQQLQPWQQNSLQPPSRYRQHGGASRYGMDKAASQGMCHVETGSPAGANGRLNALSV